ncbi:biotin--[acetyl-CoA-carboxylase] ligase [Thioalkalivibrio sp. ALJ16]|uniref:biotin--[acetyl-CoA-carboxylase] ligase n=1 Tax=Thioalkalivibrio sp. ALJ16 TaxID=1158762 RepID=UPI00036F2044|nr:biotin--[acetyl-CoA-carboxylase] ligase [Thioalkalivibrio sp. ALJ16]
MAPESARLEERVGCLLAGTGVIAPSIEVLASVDSTNRYLLDTCGDLDAPARACMALEQTAGRGRRGRVWQSLPGAGLALSLAWPLPPGPVSSGYPVGVGVGVIQALEALGVDRVRLKWPNDLVVGPAKLGGILVEQRQAQSGRPGWLVVGIGLNHEGAGALRLGRVVTDLAAQMADPVPAQEAIAAQIIARQCLIHPGLLRRGIRPLASELQRLDSLRGRAVQVLDDGRQGHALGIDPDSGCLRVEFEGEGVRHLHSGEVSVRSDEHA